MIPDGEPKSSEFTHARLNDQGIGTRHPKKQTIVIGYGTRKKNIPYSSPSTYIKKIPSAADLMKLKNIADFEKIFGPFRRMTDAWGSKNEMHSPQGWMGFTTSSDGSIRVVSVFLWTVNKGKGYQIEHRKISAGIFKPTGKPPKLESMQR